MDVTKPLIKTLKSNVSTIERKGYSRLKRIFKTGQNYSLSTYNNLAQTTTNPIIGNIPKELVNIIIKKFPENKGEVIKKIQKNFQEVATDLKKIEQILKSDIENPQDEKEFVIRSMYTHLKNSEYCQKEISKILEDINKKFQKTLSESLKIDGLETKLEFIGRGNFGHAYKLNITDSLGQDIIHSRVIKIYQDVQYTVDMEILKRQKLKSILNKYSPDELFETYIKIKNNESKNKSGFKIFLKIDDNRLKQKVTNDLAQKKADLADFDINSAKAEFLDQRRKQLDIHGIYAEANSAFRLKSLYVNKIQSSNIVDTDMFDIENKFAISQFSDDKLLEIRHIIDFDSFGLEYGDEQAKNIVNRRIIDYGGILFKDLTETGFSIIKKYFTDNNVLKYYKRIVNSSNSKERDNLIKHYLKLIENPKYPMRDKIIKAINLFWNKKHPSVIDHLKEPVHNVFT